MGWVLGPREAGVEGQGGRSRGRRGSTPRVLGGGPKVPGEVGLAVFLIDCDPGGWPRLSLAGGAHWAVPGWAEGLRPPGVGRAPFLLRVLSVSSERMWLYRAD